MKKRTLGVSGPQDAREMIALLHEALEHGVTIFGTTEAYSPLTAELRRRTSNDASRRRFDLGIAVARNDTLRRSGARRAWQHGDGPRFTRRSR